MYYLIVSKDPNLSFCGVDVSLLKVLSVLVENILKSFNEKIIN